jgi:hypothetical protein
MFPIRTRLVSRIIDRSSDTPIDLRTEQSTATKVTANMIQPSEYLTQRMAPSHRTFGLYSKRYTIGGSRSNGTKNVDPEIARRLGIVRDLGAADPG